MDDYEYNVGLFSMIIKIVDDKRYNEKLSKKSTYQLIELAFDISEKQEQNCMIKNIKNLIEINASKSIREA